MDLEKSSDDGLIKLSSNTIMGMKSKYIIFGIIILLFSCSKLTYVHDYNYKTIIDERPDKQEYNHFNNKSFDGLCAIEYGFLKYPWPTKAYDTDGTLAAHIGPPFTFFIDFNGIDRDIEYIKFDSIELVTKNRTFDLLDLQDISCQTYIFYNGKYKEPNRYQGGNNSFFEMDDFQTLQQLKEERGVSIIGLRSKGVTYTEEWVEKSEYEYNEEERKMLLEERKFNFLLKIKRIPLNIVDDEKVTVNVSLIFSLSDGSIQCIQFDDVYFREYSGYSRRLIIELHPEEKNVKD